MRYTKSEKKEMKQILNSSLNSMSHKLSAHWTMVDLLCTVPACLVTTQEGRVLRLCQTNRFKVRTGQQMDTGGRDGSCVCVCVCVCMCVGVGYYLT